MKKSVIVSLMAATILTGIAPAYAQSEEQRRGSFGDRVRAAQQQQRQPQERPQARPQAEQQRPQPQAFRQDRGGDMQRQRSSEAIRERIQDNRAVQQRSFQQQREAQQREVDRDRGPDRSTFGQRIREAQARDDRRDDRRDWRDDRRDDRRDWRDDRRDWQRDRLSDRDRWQGTRQWNNGWRNDRRYDWQRYRYTNRDLYRMPRYRVPYGWNYGYQRFSVGFFLNDILFGSSYWINDPYRYRLPAAYGSLRWVRYYDDALLIDTRDGYVVDVIYDFFY